ncbi:MULTISPECIES: hypothetical protein [Pseudoalteromonas]|uniref:Uncharacterized protein n=1 Tax=Pseudoalteromonas maricaloris TaxID=184924 RepID=A0A8I2H9H1_9GAMM|nr:MULTISPECIES: hypothetical protein [Pseudoalteromonas]NLR22591.1 hypothetical protein [Pseudoalteromonas maricaloris]RZG14762.1 hypothetical protein EXT47_12710 [Pseudoalteromonas sp. CO342X]WOX29516.1 hypothetical protein R5H13_04425 [Pseudoalteromonas maricaloris]
MLQIGTIIFGALIAALLRDYHQKQKTKVDTIHSLMDKAEILLTEIIADLQAVEEFCAVKMPLAANIQNNSRSKKDFKRLLEKRRLMAVAKETYLRKIFSEINNQDKKIYPVPTDKLFRLKRAIGEFYDDPSSASALAKVVAEKNELLLSFHRQPVIWFPWF